MSVTVNWLQGHPDYTAAETRQIIAAAFAKSSALTPRDGVIAGLAVSDGASGMQVVVAPGQAIVAGYLVTNDANTTLTLDAGGATTRTDVIALQVLDQEAGDASSTGQLVVVKGTSSAEPALPARSIKLATVNVTAGANSLTASSLTDGRGYTGSAGPIAAPGRLGVAPFSLVDYSLVFDPQADQLGVNEGNAWFKFYNTAQVDAAIAAKVAASLLETSRSTGSVTVQGAWQQLSMVTTGMTYGSGWSTPSGWTQVPATGPYSITAEATFAANATGRRGISVVDGNGSTIGKARIGSATPSGVCAVGFETKALLTAGQQVRMALFQDAAASLGVTDMRLVVQLLIAGS